MPNSKKVKVGGLRSSEKAGKGKRGRLFYAFVRRRVAAELVRQQGLNWTAAREEVEGITDADIDAKADEQKVGAIGDGKFLQWIIDHKEQIWKVIMAIFQLFLMFAEKPADAAPALAASEPPEPSNQE